MLFSRVKISCSRAKAHLVFHCCLYNNTKYHAEFTENEYFKYHLCKARNRSRLKRGSFSL